MDKIRTIYISIFFLSVCNLMLQGQVDFNPDTFKEKVSSQVYEKIEARITDKIEAALLAGEKKVLDALYIREMLEPFESFGIDPNANKYYESINQIYDRYKNEEGFSFSTEVSGQIHNMIEAKISNEIKAAIGKENIAMAQEFQKLFGDARSKITGILEAVEKIGNVNPTDSDSESQVEKIMTNYGLTGKFFESVGDLEIVLTKTYEEIKDPLEIVTAIIRATAETNPTTKIELLFDFGESYGGRIPVVGSIVEALFKVGKELLKAANQVGNLIEKNRDQYCIGPGSHAYYTSAKKKAFTGSHSDMTICPMNLSGIYKDIYYRYDENTNELFFYINGKWVDGRKSPYHKATTDIYAIVQWLRRNNEIRKATDINFISKAYNKAVGFTHFKDEVIRKKLVEIQNLTKEIFSSIDYCEEAYLELFFMDIIGFEKLNLMMKNRGGIRFQDLRFFGDYLVNEITDEFIYRRYIKDEGSLIFNLNRIADRLNANIPIYIYGTVQDDFYKKLSNVSVSPPLSNKILFNDSNCDKRKTNTSGEYSFFIISKANQESLITFKANYQGITKDEEIMINTSQRAYEVNFTFSLGQDEDSEETTANPVDEDGDGFNVDEDCNDNDASINPNAVEIADNDVDENCDGEKEYTDPEEEPPEEDDGSILRIMPSKATIQTGEDVSFRIELVDANGDILDVTDEALVTNPFNSKRSGTYTVNATYEEYSTNAAITVEKKPEKCPNENEEWSDERSQCVCVEGYERNDQGVCVEIVVTTNKPTEPEDNCILDNEKWNEVLSICVCEDGYKRNSAGFCVPMDGAANDPSGNINKCLKENEVWDKDVLDCVCIDGFKRNDNGKCVEISNEGNDPNGNIVTCLNENEVWDKELLDCVCIEGYKRNDNGKCVEISTEGNDPNGNIVTCLKDYEIWDEKKLDCVCIPGYERNEEGICVKISDPNDNIVTCLKENEVWDQVKLDCVCISGYERNQQGICVKISTNNPCSCEDGFVCDDKGNCIPIEEAIGETEEGLDEDCLKFEDVAAKINPLLSEYRGLEISVLNYIRKFNKEINDRASVPCENNMVGFTYYSVTSQLARMEQIESQLRSIYISDISFLSFNNKCPDFSKDMAAAGFDNTFVSSELQKFSNLQAQVDAMTNILIENGCDPEVVIQEGQTVQPPGSDPDFVDNGGTSTEVPGDGKDNDGDGQQDEIPVEGLPGYNITIVIYDSGNAKDDIFGLSIDGQGFLGNNPKGGLRSYGLNLPPGNYSGHVDVVLAADDFGTYTITVIHKGQSIYFDSGEPPEGTRVPFSFFVPE